MSKEAFSNLNASCRKASELASASMHRRLTLSERIGMYTHLMICKTCRQYRQQIRTLHAWLRDRADQFDPAQVLPEERLSTDAQKRIQAALRDAT